MQRKRNRRCKVEERSAQPGPGTYFGAGADAGADSVVFPGLCSQRHTQLRIFWLILSRIVAQRVSYAKKCAPMKSKPVPDATCLSHSHRHATALTK